MTFRVDDVAPPKADDPHAEPNPAGAPSEPPAASAVVDKDVDPRWTPADVDALKDFVKQLYRGAGSWAGGAAGPLPDPTDPSRELVGWMEITDSQARMIAVPMTWWMPASWIRGGSKASPLMGAVATAVAIAIVTRPKIARLEHERRVQRERSGEVRDLGTGAGADRQGAAAAAAEGEHRNGDRPTAAEPTHVRSRSAREFLRSR